MPRTSLVDYTKIATDFDRTRSYVWPCVIRFLETRSKDFISEPSLLEAGCGNGRNLLYAKKLGFRQVQGFDICDNFVDICHGKGLHEVFRADILEPLAHHQKYHTIMCIAVIHHLDTEEKREIAILNLYHALQPGGALIITVWSHEKGDSIAQKDFALGDNIVPWRSKDGSCIISSRYYYIYNETRFRALLDRLGVCYQISWEEQNWIATIIRD